MAAATGRSRSVRCPGDFRGGFIETPRELDELGQPVEPVSPPPTPRPKQRPRTLGCLIEIAETLIITIVVFLAIQTFVAQPYQVQQHSMLPTFQPGDYVLVDKLTPRFSAFERGQIVVFQPNIRETCDGAIVRDEGPEPFIKRVIGLAGDRLELRDGAVWINGAQLEEPYVHGELSQPESDEDSWVVPDGALFLMGDNREGSSDSRAFGPICARDVIGRAWIRYWPLSKLGAVAGAEYSGVPSAAPSP